VSFGELVAVLGSAELLLLLVALAASLVQGAPPPRFGPGPKAGPAEAKAPRVRDAA
jgi:hypothetical protein